MSREKKNPIVVSLLMLLLLTVFVFGSIAQPLSFDDGDSVGPLVVTVESIYDGVPVAVLMETVAPPIDDSVPVGTPEPTYLD